jgi:hypothetical protein
MEELQKELPAFTEKDYYTALEGFGKIRRNLQSACKSGLNAYKKACEEGTPYFIKVTPEVGKNQAVRIQTALDKIEKVVLPQLDTKIIEMQNKLFIKDAVTVQDIYDMMNKNLGTATPATAKVELSQLTVSVNSFKNSMIFSAGFSTQHIQRVMEYYGLDKRSTLTGSEVAALIIGIAANTTMDDIPGNLSEEDTCKYLSKIRNIDYDCISAACGMKYRDQLEHDQKLLYIMSDFGDFDPANEPDKLPVKSLRKYGYTEFLTRHMSYTLFDGPRTQFSDGLLFPIIDKDNKLTLKQVSKVVGEKGLYAALVKPAFIEKDQKEAPVQLIFRGTYCRDSLYRDINPGERVLNFFFEGPGRASFEKKQDEIVQKVFAALDKISAQNPELKVLLEVMGHSLGASDAQRALEYMAFKLSDKEKHAIAGMNLFAFNSPNVESDIARRFIDSVEKLKFPFELRYFDVHHDMVQEFGTKRIGYCGAKKAKPDNLSTSIVKFNRNLLERIEALAKNFFSKTKFLFHKEFEAHCEYSFKLHEKNDPTMYNTTFIQNIYTNSEQDLIYGHNLDKASEVISQKKMDGHLLTNTGRFGRKLKKIGFDALHILSFGQWSHDYAPRYISLKKEKTKVIA